MRRHFYQLLPPILLAWASIVAAQTPTPYLGVGVGYGGLPNALGSCGGSPPAFVFDGRLGLGWDRLHLEGRGVVRASTVVCDGTLAAPPNGIRTSRTAAVTEGREFASELHVRYRSHRMFPLITTAGAGWEWLSRFPYVNVGAGLQSGGPTRWILEINHRWAAIPFHLRTAEWQDEGMVREIGRGTDHQWQRAWDLRVGVGIPLH